MMVRILAAGVPLLIACTLSTTGQCQTRPATSGAASFYEPEPIPRGEGWYRPNVPGSPRVSGVHQRTGFRPEAEPAR